MPSETTDGHCLYDEANELLLNDQFDNALKLFSEEIAKETNSPSTVYKCHVGSAQAHLKLNNYKAALEDAEKALSLDTSDSKAFFKKGLALFNLKDYTNALKALEEGLTKAETSTTKSLFNEWIIKSKAELPVAENPVEVEEVKPVIIPTPVVKFEWYQSESVVTVSILAKNRSTNDAKVETTDRKLIVKSIGEEKPKIDFDFNLEYPILSDQTQVKYMSTKIEIKLKKCEILQWRKFNLTEADLAAQVKLVEKKPDYPSSSKKQKNWDAIAKEVDAEEEKVEGDAALNKLFRDVYANGSDETRKAMNKSFVESGGTTLSTNWSDVGSKKLDIKPPDGMEWKKY